MKAAHTDIHSISAVRTLIADDSPFMLKALAQILALEGNFALIGTATDGCQAVRQALTMEPELVLMDYRMPHLNGLEATRRIKQSEKSPAHRHRYFGRHAERRGVGEGCGCGRLCKEGR